MKKIISLLLAVTLIFTVAACTPNQSDVTESTPTPTPTNSEPTATPTLTPTPTATPEPGTRPFLASELIKNPDIWNGRHLLDKEFYVILETFNKRVIEDGLGINYASFGEDFLHHHYSADEWENKLFMEEGQINEDQKVIKSSFYPNVPNNKKEAFERIMQHFEDYYKANIKEYKEGMLLTAMDTLAPWQHYACEAGYNNIGTEIGATASPYQIMMAFTRGAAKQYDATWFMDFSPWFNNTALDFKPEDEKTWGDHSSPVGGHSLNLIERSFIMSYMGGADAMIAEAGEICSYYSMKSGSKITPYGEICKKVTDFSNKYDIGTTYTPYAVVLEKYHGMGPGKQTMKVLCHDPEAVFGHLFPMMFSDQHIYDIFNKVLWKGELDNDAGKQEADVMVNTKYGDSFDVLLQNASYELLETYPVLIFGGEIEPTEQELENYINYVKNGGIIVLNTAQTYIFESLNVNLPKNLNKTSYEEIKYGNGSFFVYGKGGMPEISTNKNNEMEIIQSGNWLVGGLTGILDTLSKKFMPFDFSAEVGYSVSVKDGTMYLYVFNNDGVYKTPDEDVVIDQSKSIDLTINYTGDHCIISAEDVYNMHNVKHDGNTISLHLEAGGMAIIEINLG